MKYLLCFAAFGCHATPVIVPVPVAIVTPASSSAVPATPRARLETLQAAYDRASDRRLAFLARDSLTVDMVETSRQLNAEALVMLRYVRARGSKATSDDYVMAASAISRLRDFVGN